MHENTSDSDHLQESNITYLIGGSHVVTSRDIQDDMTGDGVIWALYSKAFEQVLHIIIKQVLDYVIKQVFLNA